MIRFKNMMKKFQNQCKELIRYQKSQMRSLKKIKFYHTNVKCWKKTYKRVDSSKNTFKELKEKSITRKAWSWEN